MQVQSTPIPQSRTPNAPAESGADAVDTSGFAALLAALQALAAGPAIPAPVTVGADAPALTPSVAASVSSAASDSEATEADGTAPGEDVRKLVPAATQDLASVLPAPPEPAPAPEGSRNGQPADADGDPVVQTQPAPASADPEPPSAVPPDSAPKSTATLTHAAEAETDPPASLLAKAKVQSVAPEVEATEPAPAKSYARLVTKAPTATAEVETFTTAVSTPSVSAAGSALASAPIPAAGSGVTKATSPVLSMSPQTVEPLESSEPIVSALRAAVATAAVPENDAGDGGKSDATASVVSADAATEEAGAEPQSARRWAADLRAALMRRVLAGGGPVEPSGRPVANASNSGAEAVTPNAEPATQPGPRPQEAASDAGERPTSLDAQAKNMPAATAPKPAAVHSGHAELAAQPDPPPAVQAVQGPSTPRSESPPAPVQVQTPTGPVNLDQFVVRHARLIQTDRGQTWTVRLVPESLGELRIEVVSLDNQVAVRLVSPHGDVRDALDSHLHHLRESLAREGLDVTRIVIASHGSSSTQLLAGEAANPGGRHESQAPPQGSPGQSPRSDSGGAGNSPSRGGYGSPRRHQGALELWA